MNDRRPYWEYGAFIAIEDVAQAIWCAIHNPFHGHAVLNISSDDAALSEQTSVEASVQSIQRYPGAVVRSLSGTHFAPCWTMRQLRGY